MLFWRPTQNFYARDGVHLNSFGQKKYHRSLRGAILRSLSLFSTISSCWYSTFHFISKSSLLKFTYLPRHAFVLLTAVYVTDLPPLFNWAHSILAALIVLSVLQNCCLPSVHNSLYLLVLALSILCVLVNIMSVQSYSTALIWVCPQCTLIFVYQAFMSLNSCYMARHLVFSWVRLFVTIMCA